ncbi:MAG: hypothetical protein ACYC41_13370 [Bacillota bacterium]
MVNKATPRDVLSADAEYRRLALTPAVMMLVVLLAVSVTTVTIALVLGRAEELGVYKTFGARGASVRRAMTLEMLLTIGGRQYYVSGYLVQHSDRMHLYFFYVKRTRLGVCEVIEAGTGP